MRQPAGAATPQDAALRYIVAQDARDAATTCDLVTDAYLQSAAALVKAESGEPCETVMSQVFSDDGSPGVDPSDENPNVVSDTESGDIAHVRINYGIAADSAVTMAANNVTVKRINGRWLVDDSGDGRET